MTSTTSCQKTCSKRGFESFSKLRIKKRNFQLCYKHWMHCRETDFLFVRRQNDGGEKSLRAAINFGGEQCVPALGNSCLAVAAFEICALCFFSGGEGACGVFWPEWVLLHNWGVGWLTSSGPRACVGCPCQVRFGVAMSRGMSSHVIHISIGIEPPTRRLVGDAQILTKLFYRMASINVPEVMF